MLIKTVIIFSIIMACIDSTTANAYKPIFINGVDSKKQVRTFVNNKVVPANRICEDAKTKAGLNWLPSTNVSGCYYAQNKVEIEVVKFVNVYEEKQIIRAKNGDEKVFELGKVINFKRSPTKDKVTIVKGSLIWETLGLNDSDILHTHKDPSEGKMITFDSLEEFVVEHLHVLYVSKKDETTV